MFIVSYFLLVALLFCVIILGKVEGNPTLKFRNPYESHGVLLVDYITFPHIIPHTTSSVLLMIWNEAKKGDYGTDSLIEDFMTFADRAEHHGNSDNVIFSQLVVNNWPNRNLSIEIDPGLESYDFPRIYWFAPGSTKPIFYPKHTSINVIQLTRFLSSATTFYLDLPGTVEEYYYLAKKYSTSIHDNEEKTSVINEAKEKLKTLVATSTNALALTYYIHVMEKINSSEKGLDYVMEEIMRLETMISDKENKISIEKRNELQKKVNILHNFMTLESHGFDPSDLPSSGTSGKNGISATLSGISGEEF
jgi:hypothetical protein